ncbi:prolyl oligopeptidase family serine peptidase [Kaistia geumhonensis]|uniref:Pimeloyl-ACP methyl ester carboxylesterase n=1 Tax=Kaistia geumhonensis TaxID=410839 RepID=A0ABU0MBJ4_9HYPH|nr:alpha/beta hydrolase [Kaistia geumhonensis]MCX5481265.1 prolyl oligopeptidase family serine peptidase [Kaistia geumhonensis]MDQ0518326.1 pimeloyl-ACP methyl ester carboxylesterase [Kaistia geumhonensis]
MRRLLRSLVTLAAFAAPPAACIAAASPVEVGPTISYEEIGSWDVAKLNEILTRSAPETFGVSVTYAPATNGVTLYRVTYGSVVPERGNRPIVATGLLAVPNVDGKTLPLVSYQHGTVYGKEDVPSFPDNSSETQLMIAAFAGRGYAMIGADYFGMGGSAKEPEGYGVKASHQQATFDMLAASRAVLASKGIATDKLFLGGWSQGGYVTMCFLERLEKTGVAVTAASTASGPADLYSFLSGFLDFPRENDASWISILYVLSSFSFEQYYGEPGLARSLFTDEYYETARKIYTRGEADISALPSDLTKLIRADYFDPTFFAESAYGRIAKESDAYRWIIKTPLRSYYGEADEVVSVGLAELAANYQQGIGGGNDKVVAISTGKTDHRGTFAKAVAEWQTWFDGVE